MDRIRSAERRGGRARSIFVCCVMMVLMLCESAAAEFSPRWGEWRSAWEQGAVVTAEASMRVESAEELTEETLAQLNRLLDALVLRAALAVRDGEAAGAALLQLGSARAGIAVRGEETEPFLWEAAALGEHLEGLLRRAYSVLDGASGASEELHASVNIRNVGASSGGTVWYLSGEALTEVWNALADEIENDSALGPVMAMIPEWEGGRSMIFSGNCTVKRLRDASGRDMGLQVNGSVRRGDEADRKLTLLAGWKEGSAYLNLNAAPKRGAAVKMTISYALRETSGQNRLELSASYQSEKTWALECSLKNSLGETETLTGTLDWTEKKGNLKSQLLLKPAITLDADRILGEVEITWSPGGAQAARVRVTANLSRGREEDLAIGNGGADTGALYRELLYRMERLEPEQRRLITHTLRTAEWMFPAALTGPLSSVQPADTGEWSVKEEE